jgi:hypothetical protein
MSHSLERLFSPGLFDIIFPFFAFFFVIVLPSAFGIYVIWRVLSGQYSGEAEKPSLPKDL